MTFKHLNHIGLQNPKTQKKGTRQNPWGLEKK